MGRFILLFLVTEAVNSLVHRLARLFSSKMQTSMTAESLWGHGEGDKHQDVSRWDSSRSVAFAIRTIETNTVDDRIIKDYIALWVKSQ
ncbi:hypothetical protein B0J14DRAFT_16440 [Halenospora varia]|nr:hypothetical protein B0J14DRAFT_16440 [Halenospora varia]